MENRLLIATVAALIGFGLSHLHALNSRLDDLERSGPSPPDPARELSGRLDLLERQLLEARQLSGWSRGELPPELRERLDHIERGLDVTCESLEVRARELELWREEHARSLSEELGSRLESLDRGARERWTQLAEALDDATRMARDARNDLESLRGAPGTDGEALWRELMGPTVQLCGETTVGTGVLLPSEPAGEAGRWRTRVLTAWHVVRDILPDRPGPQPTVPVRVYRADGGSVEEEARLVRHDPRLDVALLELCTERRFECGVRLAPRARLEGVRTFDAVYAVGCPLGNDPIPTFGHIADTRHVVDQEAYWMVSAPTYIGNSGGGIFDAETHELIGIFSKIYTHGSLRPTVVPHMGLATPLDEIYDWMVAEGLAALVPAAPRAASPVLASGSAVGD